ncbi:MAG: SPOR domain-containing protein [Betaproteobacteria bacterium]|nr:MAG: SPOR domain-containing protein [Betaproteobacteria bacterium]
MRWLFFFLLLVNVALAGYGYLHYTRPNPDAKIVDFQMNADKIRIVPEPVIPAAQRAARQPTACLEWGSFGDLELRRVSEALAPMVLDERITARKQEVTTDWWVFMPPQGSRARMDRKADELVDLGITDFVKISEAGRWRYAISLGTFQKEDGARAYLTELRGKGIRTGEVGRREQRTLQTTLVIRAPSPEESTQLVELARRFPGSDMRATEC